MELTNDNTIEERRPPRLGARIKALLFTPRAEWEEIAEEPETAARLYRRYIAPLAAIGPLCAAIGAALTGVYVPFFGRYRAPVGVALGNAAAAYALALVSVFALALIIDALAPSFGGERSRLRALKLAAYSATPGWLAGVFGLVPAAALLGVLASLYGLYLLYLGLPRLMRAPEEKAAVYAAVVVGCAALLALAASAISSELSSYPL
jgi:hypothetical protein